MGGLQRPGLRLTSSKPVAAWLTHAEEPTPNTHTYTHTECGYVYS